MNDESRMLHCSQSVLAPGSAPFSFLYDWKEITKGYWDSLLFLFFTSIYSNLLAKATLI